MPKRTNIKIDHSEAAFYTDNITVSHGPSKFILDFKQSTPRIDFVGGENQHTMVVKHKTILMDAPFAKIFLKTLESAVKKYEKQFGKIKIPKQEKKKSSKKIAQTGSHYIG